MLKNPRLRELYDKTEFFIRRDFEATQLNPGQGERYLQSFGELSFFSFFVIALVMYVEKHQNFAKQVVIGSMLFFGWVIFSLKEPIEGEEENQVVEFVSSLDFAKEYTIFEIVYILKRVVFPAFYQMALNMSRVFDTNPLENL